MSSTATDFTSINDPSQNPQSQSSTLSNNQASRKFSIIQIALTAIVVIISVICLTYMYLFRKNINVKGVLDKAVDNSKYHPTVFKIYDKSTQTRCNRLIVVEPFTWYLWAIRGELYILNPEGGLRCPYGSMPAIRVFATQFVETCLSLDMNAILLAYVDGHTPVIVPYEIESETFTILSALNLLVKEYIHFDVEVSSSEVKSRYDHVSTLEEHSEPSPRTHRLEPMNKKLYHIYSANEYDGYYDGNDNNHDDNYHQRPNYHPEPFKTHDVVGATAVLPVNSPSSSSTTLTTPLMNTTRTLNGPINDEDVMAKLDISKHRLEHLKTRKVIIDGGLKGRQLNVQEVLKVLEPKKHPNADIGKIQRAYMQHYGPNPMKLAENSNVDDSENVDIPSESLNEHSRRQRRSVSNFHQKYQYYVADLDPNDPAYPTKRQHAIDADDFRPHIIE